MNADQAKADSRFLFKLLNVGTAFANRIIAENSKKDLNLDLKTDDF